MKKSDPVSAGGSKRIPTLQYCVCCEGLNPQGGINSLVDRVVIGFLQHFSVLLKWVDGKGQFVQTVRLLDPDLKEIKSDSSPFKLEDRAYAQICLSNFGKDVFKIPGIHWIEVLVDDQTALSVPLPVYDHQDLSSKQHAAEEK